MKVLEYRFVRLVIGLVMVTLGALLPRVMASAGVLPASFPEPWVSALSAALGLVAFLVYLKFIERRPASELSKTGALQEFVIGLAIGAVLIFATIFTLKMMGLLEFGPRNAAPQYLKALLSIGLIAAVVEEILFRGLIFKFIQDWVGSAVALAVSALLFGLIHLMNPSATLVSSLAISLEAGILLGAAYMVNGRLWLPIGLHLAWNALQAGVFGSVKTTTGLYSVTTDGPALLTGGSAGPESSIIAIGYCLCAAGILLWVARHRGRWVPLQRS